MKCSSGKKAYDTEVRALEALVHHYVQNNKPIGSGPTNVYRCDHCGAYHFTSKGPIHKALSDPDIKGRIDNQATARYWEDKLGRG